MVKLYMNMKGMRFMVRGFITKIRKDEEFRKLYDVEKSKLDIAVALVKARNKKQLTQSDVAKKAGVRWETVSRIENGRVNSSLDVLSRVFAAVGKRIRVEVSGIMKNEE